MPLTICATTYRCSCPETYISCPFWSAFARWEITILSFIPFLLGFLWFAQGTFWMAILPLLALPFVFRNVRDIWHTEPSFIYNEFLARSALCQLLFGCLLALGIYTDLN